MDIKIISHNKGFKGAEKHLIHFLAPYERVFLRKAVPLVPSGVNTAHLTLMTIIWSMAIVFSGYRAVADLRWLWLFNAAVILQYVTDMLDGEVGRLRDNGLVKWGFYMDHFLDYVFLSSIIISYAFLLPASYDLWVVLCMASTAGFMVHTLMDFSITNNLKISYNQFGVSELRVTLVLANVFLMLFGRQWLVLIFPYVVLLSLMGLGLLVYSSQKIYRHLDTLQQAKRD